LEREETQQLSKLPLKLPLDNDDNEDNVVPTDNFAPPPLTAPPALASKKRARKHTTVYREAFTDSQDDPTVGIKRGKAGGLL
jgi:hypothetical protein